MSQNRSRGNAEPPHVQPKQGRVWIPYEVELARFLGSHQEQSPIPLLLQEYLSRRS